MGKKARAVKGTPKKKCDKEDVVESDDVHAQDDDSSSFQAIDKLIESKPGRSTRLDALRCLRSLFLSKPEIELTSRWLETITEAIQTSISRGKKEEILLSLHCLNAVALSVPEGFSESLFTELSKSLRTAAEVGNSPLVRGEASFSLGIIASIGCPDDSKIEEIELWFASRSNNPKWLLFHPQASHVRVEETVFHELEVAGEKAQGLTIEAEGFLRGWFLLVSSWRPSVLVEYETSPCEAVWSFASCCLAVCSSTVDCVPMKLSAGILLALVLEALWKVRNDDRLDYHPTRYHHTLHLLGTTEKDSRPTQRKEEENEDDAPIYESPARSSRRPSIAKQEVEFRMTRILKMLKELASTSGGSEAVRGLGRTDRKEQVSTFKKILLTAEDGEVPEVKFCIGGRDQTIILSGWAITQRYKLVQQVFGGSLSLHMQQNSPVAEYVLRRSGFGSVGSGWQTFQTQDTSTFNHDVRSRKMTAKQRGKCREWQRARKFSMQTMGIGE